ncbi:type II secretion system F family protein [Actinokineospora diospyrosa]|uniref:Flp pilus assembly protein TadB n=1 Tax=Actinokineospora diospyrosa TaxID=103728 RepID=A0ABT1I5P6_9PSEU|nr:type II secretion system F family protein [Actinokineospora diospyrosa]MCP2267953.1 Flp pilus assembly protein TadB [Actinokineospora diospyrosa]
MTATTALLALLGVGVAAGLLLIVAGARGVEATDVPSKAQLWIAGLRRHAHARLLAAAVLAGLVAGMVTGWLVGGALTALAVAGLPQVLGGTRGHDRALARIEGIASWTEMLRDVIAAAAGLEQAILATAATAPEAIRGEIEDLATRLDRGDRLGPSLRLLADDLADPTADLVLAALVLAADRQARQLAELLGELAAEAREQAAMRMRVEAGRARTRTSVRVILITTLAFAGGLVVFNRSYLEPYDTAFGQLMLLLVGALFAVSFVWLGRIARLRPAARVLAGLTHLPTGATEVQP